jgi:hypothetical protein
VNEDPLRRPSIIVAIIGALLICAVIAAQVAIAVNRGVM